MKGITTVLLIVAAIALFAWIANPMWGVIQGLRTRSAEVQNALSGLNDTKQLQQDLIATYNSLSDEQLDRLLNQGLPEKPDTGNLLIAMEKMAEANHMKLHTIDFKKPETRRINPFGQPTAAKSASTDVANEQMFSFTVTGSYEDFKSFLGDLERHIRLIDVQDIAFGTGVDGVYRFTISAKTYYQK